MKKLIVLVSALLLVSMVAVATDNITFTGEIEQRWAQDLNNKNYQQGPVVELKIDMGPHDFSTAYLEFEEAASGIETGAAFDRAYFDLDLGGIFDLPVGVTIRTGFDEYDQFDAVKITFGEYVDIIGSDDAVWGHEINIMPTDMVALRVLWANDPGKEYYSAGVAVTYDPVYVEASYVNISSGNDATDTFQLVEDSGKGDIEAGLEVMLEEVAAGIDVAVAGALDFDLEADDGVDESALATDGDSYYEYAAAVNVTYNDMAALGIAFRGEQESAARSIQVDVSAAPIEGIELFLVAGLGLDGDIYDDTFESFEGSLMFMLGPATWYAGLLWSAETAPDVIASEKADFVAEEADMMSIFMRAELKY